CANVLGLDRLVRPGERLRSPSAQRERLPDQEELRSLARRRRARLQLRQRASPRVPVDGPAVVWVDEAEVPQLVALVDVRHAGARELEQRLRERDLLAELRDALDERVERR